MMETSTPRVIRIRTLVDNRPPSCSLDASDDATPALRGLATHSVSSSAAAGPRSTSSSSCVLATVATASTRGGPAAVAPHARTIPSQHGDDDDDDDDHDLVECSLDTPLMLPEVMPGLHLGSHTDVRRPHVVARRGITAFLSLCDDTLHPFPPHIAASIPDAVVFDYPLANDATTVLADHTPRIFAFLDEQFDEGRNVVVYDKTGTSLAAAFVVAYAMRRGKFKLPDALAYVTSALPATDINKCFVEQLRGLQRASPRVASSTSSLPAALCSGK